MGLPAVVKSVPIIGERYEEYPNTFNGALLGIAIGLPFGPIFLVSGGIFSILGYISDTNDKTILSRLIRIPIGLICISVGFTIATFSSLLAIWIESARFIPIAGIAWIFLGLWFIFKK